MRSNKLKLTRTPLALSLALALACLMASGCGSPAGTSPKEGEHRADSHESEGSHAGEEEHEEGVVEISPEAAAAGGVRTAVASRQRLAPIIETTGQVGYDENRLAHVSPRISGRADRVLANLGDRVVPGQVLAVLDSIELGQAKATYIRARAQHDLTRRSYERERALREDKISSEREVQTAEAAFQEASADVAAAEQALHLYGLRQEEIAALRSEDPQASLFSLRSPIAGTVVEKHITRGELATSSDRVLTIADLSQVWIAIDIYERDLAHVHLGDGAEALLESYPTESFHGTVSYLADQIDPDTRTLRARIAVDNPKGQLRPGAFARVLLTDPHSPSSGATAPEVITVPDDALQREGDGHVVYVADGPGRFRERAVRIGRRSGELVEILDGIQAGETVVVEGTFLLKSQASQELLGGGHSH